VRVWTRTVLLALSAAACAHPDTSARPSPHDDPRPRVENAAARSTDARDGWARFLGHDYAGSARSYERAFGANSGDDVSLYLTALASLRAGDTPAAMTWLTRLADLGSDLVPTDAQFHDLAPNPEFRTLTARIAANSAHHRRSAESFRTAEKGLMVEGIAYDPVEGAFYLGSVRRRKIVKVPRGRPPADFVTPRAGLDAVGGIRVDAGRRRLWAVSSADARQDGFTEAVGGRNALVEIDLGTGALLGSYPLSEAGEHVLNDVAVDADGRPFATDTRSGQIYTLAQGRRSLAPLFDTPPFLYPNGLTFDDEGKVLFVGDASGVHRVDVKTRNVTRLAQAQGIPLVFIDGLYFVRSQTGPRLVGIQVVAGPGRVLTATLSPALDAITRVEILESNHPSFDAPTTGAIVGGAMFMIANSQQWVPREPSETIVLKTPL